MNDLLPYVKDLLEAAGKLAEYERDEPLTVGLHQQHQHPLLIETYPVPPEERYLGETLHILIGQYAVSEGGKNVPNPEVLLTKHGLPILFNTALESTVVMTHLNGRGKTTVNTVQLDRVEQQLRVWKQQLLVQKWEVEAALYKRAREHHT